MASTFPHGRKFISYLRREQIKRLLSTRYRVDGRGWACWSYVDGGR